MNLKYLTYSIASLIFGIALWSCNSDNEFKVDGELSPDGRIVSFKVDARAYNANDSLTYPALKTTVFTIQSRGGYNIFNVDSLPMGTSIRSLKVDLQYGNNTHTRTDLVYPNDSIVEWNETDSVKFMPLDSTKLSGKYYPEFRVIAPTGYKRDYTVFFNIHKQDPDSIKWVKQAKELSVNGESKVISNKDQSGFISFTNNGSAIQVFSSSSQNLVWTEISQSGEVLPKETMVKSLLATKDKYVILTNKGVAYTSPIEGGINWTKHDKKNIQSVIGQLPEVAEKKATPLNEFLITYLDANNTLVYGKTVDFEAVENVSLTGRNDNKLISGFPIKNYTSLLKIVNEDPFVILIGGKDSDKKDVTKTWTIKNISLADASKSALAEVSIFPGSSSKIVPFHTQVTAFLYDEKVYTISSDSLSLYHSTMGDRWDKAKKQQKLHKDMVDMNLPSVVVDKENFMWVFGGASNEENPTYSKQIWKGRINRLAPKN